MRKVLDRGLGLIVVALYGYLTWTMIASQRVTVFPYRPRPDLASARFAVAYARAREGVDYFSRCDPKPYRVGLQDERIATQQRFTELRKAAAEAKRDTIVELVDMEQQVLSEDARGYVDNAMICTRLGAAGPTTQTAAMALIGAAEMVLKQGR